VVHSKFLVKFKERNLVGMSMVIAKPIILHYGDIADVRHV